MRKHFDPDLIGQRVISVSNSSPQVECGKIVGWHEIKGQHFPLLEMERDGRTVFSMTVLLPWEPHLFDLLLSMADNAYVFATKISQMIQTVHRMSQREE